MKPIRRILVAVKSTGRKKSPAIAKAAALARALDARLELFHAITDPVAFDALSGSAFSQHLESGSARHSRRLEQIAEPLRQQGITVATSVEWDYPAHEAVVRRARAIGADLIVAERHAGRHVARWLMRYPDWELLRQSPVPVLLVKRARVYKAPRILAAIDPTHAFDKSARLDQSILELAGSIAGAVHGTLHVLHAYVPTAAGLDARRLNVANAAQLIIDEAEKQAVLRVDKALRAADLASLDARRRHLVPLHAANAIPALARKLASDMVVMGALSRSGMKGLIIGNTAERVLDELRCDVLVVKPPGFESAVGTQVRGPELYFATPPAAMP
jgi:universal stress protein E